MSDGKKRRYRKNKQQDEKRPVILAKRETNVSGNSGGSQKQVESDVQPKILLKTAGKSSDGHTGNNSTLGVAGEGSGSGGGVGSGIATTSPSSEILTMQAQKTVIVTRGEASHSPLLSGFSPNLNKEAATGLDGSNAVTHLQQQPQIYEPVPRMTRPATVISSTGFINSGVKKLLLKSNSDFLVVGVIGMQGVGKSTIMNLLANEESNYDYFNKVFVEEDAVFPTKLKQHKCSTRSRTESTHMFITSDRLILLDSPPVLCNSYKKDMTTNELDDIRNIVTFLSVCNLVIVVQDDYFNMNFMRLLQFGELMKPSLENKPFVSDYFPNILFVKNRAKRQDFIPGQKERMDKMLKMFFKDSQLRIYLGQTAAEQQQQRTSRGKSRGSEAERIVNSFLLPEVKTAEATSFHPSLLAIVEDLRSLVFMTPRNEMYSGPNELNEAIWFELLTMVSADNQNFFFNTYEEIQRKNLDVVCAGGGGSTKEAHDSWSEK